MKQGMEILTTENKKSWDRIVQSSYNYDFYHLSSYHHIAELRGEGKAYLFVYKENGKFIAAPFLLRPIWKIEGLKERGKALFDVTSVYGYPGPVSNVPLKKNDILLRFGKTLLNIFKEKSIITAFSRLHPIWENNSLLKTGDLICSGKTVSIDLSLPLEEQWSQFRDNHKRDIKKLRSMNVKVYLDDDWKYLENFIKNYTGTMHQVEALKYYFFDKQYFLLLKKYLEKNLKLFVAEYDEQIIGSGLFSLCNSIVQYHLGGVDPNLRKFSPLKIIFDEVRIWAIDQKAKFFHLGGGVGSCEDSLFNFKAGFSNRYHQFYMWKLVVNPSIFKELRKAHKKWRQENQWDLINPDYFPSYRSALKKVNCAYDY